MLLKLLRELRGSIPRLFVVGGNSMLPTLRTGDLVLTMLREPCPCDIAVFEGPPGLVIHRVCDVLGRNAGKFLRTRGDANARADSFTVPADRVVGVVEVCLPHFGILQAMARLLVGRVKMVSFARGREAS